MTELSDEGELQLLPLIRQPLHLLLVYCLAYGAVFVVGLVGNVFVLATVALHRSMRSVTNYFISSLACADLLIVLFCLPATLMNSILYEWHMGDFLCKLSNWMNGTTTCTSIYIMLAVTADRYFAICHTLRYSIVDKKYTFLVIGPIWLTSGLLFTPWMLYFGVVHYPLGENSSAVARVCQPNFPDPRFQRALFLVLNMTIGYLIPLAAITFMYAVIFHAILNRPNVGVVSACESGRARSREHRLRIRITNMMLTVIVVFALSWLPLFCLFTYLTFLQPDVDGAVFQLAQNVMRPMFQWLSLANSSINPILYAYFSRRYRLAFQQLLVLPCRRRYEHVYRSISRMRRTHKGAAGVDDRLPNTALRSAPPLKLGQSMVSELDFDSTATTSTRPPTIRALPQPRGRHHNHSPVHLQVGDDGTKTNRRSSAGQPATTTNCSSDLTHPNSGAKQQHQQQITVHKDQQQQQLSEPKEDAANFEPENQTDDQILTEQMTSV